MLTGVEIDMLSLGDADCIILTTWYEKPGTRPQAFRILIDGGNAGDYQTIREFLRRRGITEFWAAVCTHLHQDHAAGLIKLVQDKTLNITNGWMRDIRKHFAPEVLRRASAGSSQEAKAAKQVIDTTEELAAAFTSRPGLVLNEPFAGASVAGSAVTVLGPSTAFYKSTIREFIDEADAIDPAMAAALSGIFGVSSDPYSGLGAPLAPANRYVPLSGLLRRSGVERKPETQPFNNTSTILGVIFDGERLLLTADAGSKALDLVPADWKAVNWMQGPHHGSDGNLSRTNIERFCPKVTFISAGGGDHPDQVIVNGLMTAGSTVFSTHSNPAHLWYYLGNVPVRTDYGPAVPLKSTSNRIPDPPSLSRLGLLRALSDLR